MTYVLVIWTVVAASHFQGSVTTHRDWRAIGEFKNSAACLRAAEVMRKPHGQFVCIPTDTVK